MALKQNGKAAISGATGVQTSSEAVLSVGEAKT